MARSAPLRLASASMSEHVDQVAADTVIEAIKLARHDPEELRRSLDEQVWIRQRSGCKEARRTRKGRLRARGGAGPPKG